MKKLEVILLTMVMILSCAVVPARADSGAESIEANGFAGERLLICDLSSTSGPAPSPESTSESAEALYNKGLEAFFSDDYSTALICFQQAADQGYADAEFDLGIMYMYGYGVEQSYENAAQYFQLAADHGHAEAQFDLGLMYGNGYGVEQSYEKAAQYFQLAADQGYAEAQSKLESLRENGYIQ